MQGLELPNQNYSSQQQMQSLAQAGQTQNSFGNSNGANVDIMMPNQKLVNSKKKVNDKTMHVFKNLSMSNEEKILKRNYGANYESTVANLSNSRLLQLGRTQILKSRSGSQSAQQMWRKVSAKAYQNNSFSTLKQAKNLNNGQMLDPYNIYDQSLQRSGMYDSPQGGGGSMNFREKYFLMQERSAALQIKMNQVQSNRSQKFLDLQSKHQLLQKKEQTKENKINKYFKEQNHQRSRDILNNKEKAMKIQNQKKFIDKERNMKMEQMGNKLAQRLGGFGVSQMSSSFKLLNKRSIADPDKGEQEEGQEKKANQDSLSPPRVQSKTTLGFQNNHQTKHGLNQSLSAQKLGNVSLFSQPHNIDLWSQSQNQLKPKNEQDLILKKIGKIEMKIQLAQQNREMQIADKFSRSIDQVKIKMEEAKQRLEHQKEKNQYDIMVKVILKHANKAKALKKKIKEEREKIEVKAEKRVKLEDDCKLKLKILDQNWDQKKKQILMKARKLEEKTNEQNQYIDEKKYEKHEENLQRNEEHQKMFQKVKRAQSTYKVHLVNKIVEKTMRADEIEFHKQQVQLSAFKNRQLVDYHSISQNLQPTIPIKNQKK